MDMFTAHENFMKAQKALLANRKFGLYFRAWLLKVKTERYIRKAEKLKAARIAMAHDVKMMNLRLSYQTANLNKKESNS